MIRDGFYAWLGTGAAKRGLGNEHGWAGYFSEMDADGSLDDGRPCCVAFSGPSVGRALKRGILAKSSFLYCATTP